MNTRQTDMHGTYEVLHSKGSEGRDLKTGDLNLKKLSANFRFASDKVPAQNPWARTAPFNGDFILIAEFSENEGPKPVMTIPITGGNNFDINAFAVHVMSVDYAQTKGDFSIVEDTQLLLSEKKEGIYAYIHRFTLHDIHARGFVRPYCMCYISHCKRKMYSFLDALMDEFTKVSRLFRHGNRITFIRDLEQRLSEVLAMKTSSSLVNFNAQEPTGQKLKDMDKTKNNVNEECEYIFNETKKLIEVLRPHMVHDSRIVQQFKRLESLAEGRSRSLTDAPDYSLLKQGKSHHRTPLFVKPQSSLRRAFSLPDLKDLLTGQKEVKPKPRLSSCRNSMKELRHLHELCGWGAKEGLNRLRTILKHYNREAAALLIEKTETSHLERFPSLLTIGRSVVSNFLHKVEVKCVSSPWTKETLLNLPNQGCFTRNSSNGSLYSLESFQSCLEDELVGSARSSDEIISPFSPSASFHADLQGVESSSYTSSDDSRVDNTDVVSIHSDTSLGAAKERLSLADYALLDEDALSDYSESRVYSRQTSTIVEANPSLQLSQTRGITRSLESINMIPSDRRSKRHHKQGKLGTFPVFRKSNPVTLAKSEKGTSICSQDVTSRSINSRNNLSVRHAFKRSKSEGGAGGTASGDEKLHQKRLSFSFRPEKIRLRCFAEEVSQPLESYSGSNVLFLRKNLSCGVYLLYALLSGRPVVVLAEPRNEREVRIILSALWMFVPENTSHGKAVVPWRTKPLQMADLSWLKLVGLAKNKHMNMLPKSVKRYVSVLNFETDLIETPQYKGHYLRSFCNYANQWPTNAALVAFVHSVFLELANKSYVYYYAYCLGGLKWCCCESNQRSDFGQVVESRDASETLRKLRVYFSDAKIVQYFAELIKQQQVDFYQSQHHDQDFAAEGAVSPDSDSSAENASLIIADLSKCAVFRNVKPLD